MNRIHVPTVEQAYRRTLAALRGAKLCYGHGSHDAAQEAAYFVSFVLKRSPEDLDEHRDAILSPVQRRRLERFVEQRIAKRIPAAYLTREAWLGGFPFYVDRRAIIPRSHIAELLRGRLERWLDRPPRRVLDLCTGSGCLAILAALAFPAAKVCACDISADALAVARRNVERYALGQRIRLLRSDLLAALGTPRYDLILSNPPYVTGRSMARLPPEYLHEPRLALAGGADGLEIVRRILRDSARHLAGQGVLVCEVGSNRKALEKAFPRLAFTWIQTSGGANEVFLVERKQLEDTVPPTPPASLLSAPAC